MQIILTLALGFFLPVADGALQAQEQDCTASHRKPEAHR